MVGWHHEFEQEKLLNMAVSTENETNEEFDLKKKINKKK